MTAAFAIAYDWLYDAWTPQQRQGIMGSIITLGLSFGTEAHDIDNWWRGDTITGNWNCVCNSGLTLGALAILDDDNSGIAQTILARTIENAQGGCAHAPSTDGSWTETPNYWSVPTR